MLPHFTVNRLRTLRTGETLPTPVHYLTVRKLNKWFVLENRILHTKRFYSHCEDILEVILRERYAS